MRLQTFVKKSGMTMRKFSEMLQINYCYLSEIANGIRPSVNIALKIQDRTQGAVKASTLLRQKSKNYQKKQKTKKAENEVKGIS